MSSRLLNPFHAQINGHETFPLRQLWIPKLTRYLRDMKRKQQSPALNGEDAIVKLGVGKNMVNSMRFWANASGMVDYRSYQLTELGELIFGSVDGAIDGLDESASSMTTQWLIHWRLASNPSSFTPIWFLFNKVNLPFLDRACFLDTFTEFCKTMEVKTTQASMKRGVDVTLRSYLPRLSGKGYAEDFIEPLLAELDLLEPRSRDVFAFKRGAHPTLRDELFVFALLEYWENLEFSTSTLEFTRITHDIGSPGKVFKLDQDSVSKRLFKLAELTEDNLVWTEQAGLRQVIKRGEALTNSNKFKLKLLRKAYN